MAKTTEPALNTPVLDALNAAVAKALHLGDLDAPAVEAARALALKIDMAARYFEALADYAADMNGRPPSQDNVSIPTFLKYCESLGLTPAGRNRAAVEPGKGATRRGTQVGKFRTLAGGKSA